MLIVYASSYLRDIALIFKIAYILLRMLNAKHAKENRDISEGHTISHSLIPIEIVSKVQVDIYESEL